MNSLLAAILLVHGVTASFNSAANNAVSAADVLNKEVSGWSSAQGLQGALAIQNDFPALSSALVDFQNAVQGASAGDIDTQATHHFSASLSTLVDSLSQKAADFAAVSAAGIAAGDLKSLSGPAVGIIDGLIKALGEDSSKWSEVSRDVDGLEQKLNNANKAYGVNELQFSPNPTFNQQSSASSSASVTSSASANAEASSSAKASEGTSKASAAEHTSTAKSSTEAAHTVAAHNGTTNGTISSTHPTPKIKNGASSLLVGGTAVVAAGAAALFL